MNTPASRPSASTRATAPSRDSVMRTSACETGSSTPQMALPPEPMASRTRTVMRVVCSKNWLAPTSVRALSHSRCSTLQGTVQTSAPASSAVRTCSGWRTDEYMILVL